MPPTIPIAPPLWGPPPPLPVPVSGTLPKSLYPSQSKGTIVRSFHGTKDTVVPYISGENTSAAFYDAGYNIVFTPADVGHVLSAMEPQIKPVLVALVQ